MVAWESAAGGVQGQAGTSAAGRLTSGPVVLLVQPLTQVHLRRPSTQARRAPVKHTGYLHRPRFHAHSALGGIQGGGLVPAHPPQHQAPCPFPGPNCHIGTPGRSNRARRSRCCSPGPRHPLARAPDHFVRLCMMAPPAQPAPGGPSTDPQPPLGPQAAQSRQRPAVCTTQSTAWLPPARMAAPP